MASGITPIGIQRIERRLDLIIPLLDMDDYANRPQQKRQAALSRALAAYCIKTIGSTDDKTAAESVTDRFHDRGIDAIYFDQASSQLLLVQSKWSVGIDWKDAGEFTDGVRNLINANWAAFAKNAKIFDRRNEFEIALRGAAKIVLITIHHGSQPADGAVLRRVSELASEIDGGMGLAEAASWHQQHLLDSLQRESDPPKVNADLYLSNWGEIKEPYYAVFGRVQGQAIAELWKKHPHLAYLNLRDYAKRSDVNVAIAKTAKEEPHHFWYFNNGLTIICDSITPGILGRLDPRVTVFRLEGISLVNGAQTTGIVGDNFDSIADDEKGNLWIQLRAIAVKGCPDDFAKRVTKFTNLQNAVTIQDFVSLDPLHSRIATDFAIERRRYAFRWGGEADPTGEHGCNLKEATIALACAQPDPWFAVQAKREISVLWDTESTRYKELFHANLTASKIWNAVNIMRHVDAHVWTHEIDAAPRSDMVANHLQRIILHIVFQDPELKGWESATDHNLMPPIAVLIAKRVFEQVRQDVTTHHSGEYLASLSKNFDKCSQLVHRVRHPGTSPKKPGDQLLLDGLTDPEPPTKTD